ncbi:histidine kinase [Pseudomonas maumuensis]|uniref:Histidine kinase n=1 Tax=Pseudomonas maumuensis TaxID=2842354 RepID=A0ABX8NTY0_9PSED|nr:histidine kinase [Pseudomonas maumuensis]QXH59207.1 histidine kinase [Pseudomonas maumuensis]
MDSTPLHNAAVAAFLQDAQVLLARSQECLQHLELITNDPDACHSLNAALDTLARRAIALGLHEVAHHTLALQRLIAPACAQQHLHGDSLSALAACLTLLDWQLELLDPQTGRLDMDTEEQRHLLTELAITLGQPASQLCADCQESGVSCAHPHAQGASVEQSHAAADRQH